jgi:hypothetical protein
MEDAKASVEHTRELIEELRSLKKKRGRWRSP